MGERWREEEKERWREIEREDGKVLTGELYPSSFRPNIIRW